MTEKRRASIVTGQFSYSYDDLTGLICLECGRHIWSENRSQHEQECPKKEPTHAEA
jgi:hypothetical protein